MADIERAISPNSNVKIIQFADDICLYNSERTTRNAVINLDRDTQSVADWLADRGLYLAEHKTQFCVFRHVVNSHNKPQKWQICINKTTIRSTNRIKFLGIYFQDDAKWNSQIEKIVKSCTAPLNFISFLSTMWWGAAPEILLLLYRSLVRSRIEYGAFIWFQLSSKQLTILNRIQYRGIRKALGYRQSTPINIMLAEAKEPPLGARFTYLCNNYLTRALSNNNHQLREILENIQNFYNSPTTCHKSGQTLLSKSF